MKKIAFALIMAIGCLYGANETLKNGTILHPHINNHNEYLEVKESNGRTKYYTCQGNILYAKGGIADNKGRALTFNPHTGNPYFCEYKGKVEEGRYFDHTDWNVVILYSFDKVGK